jgi:hypothetical protein
MNLRHFARSLALVGALTALSVPVFSMTQGASKASACSNTGCVITVIGGSGFDTYISPLTATIGTATFDEVQTTRQPLITETVTTSGSLGFSVYDLRGNNQGFTAYLSCTGADMGMPCLSSSQAPQGIPASAVTVAGPTLASGALFFGDGIGPAVGLDATGASLDSPVAVGGECYAEVIGQGIYDFAVPLALTLSYPYNEYVTLPVSFVGNFTLTVVENVSPSACVV